MEPDLSDRIRERAYEIWIETGYRDGGYAPLVPFDPGADGVPYASVFHQGILHCRALFFVGFEQQLTEAAHRQATLADVVLQFFKRVVDGLREAIDFDLQWKEACREC